MRAYLWLVLAACFTASCAGQTICDYVTCVEGDDGGGAGGDASGGGGSGGGP